MTDKENRFSQDERLESADREPIGSHAAPSPAPSTEQTEDATLFQLPLEAEDPEAVRPAAHFDDVATGIQGDADPVDDLPAMAGQPVPIAPAPMDPEPIAAPTAEPIGAHAAEADSVRVPSFLAAEAAEREATRPVSPEDTAEIDAEAVEAKLNDPGSTMSFEPITDELIDASSTYDAGTTTQLMWGARSDVGCVRSHNEDSYLVQSPLFCVCDGMGGHAAGEVASSIAVETIAKTAPHTADPALLGAAIEAANAAVIEAAVNGLGKPGMGCTATAAYIDGGTMAIAHVGDSRAYLLHEESLIRVTRDHSYVEELVDAGEITADEARVHPNRSVITRALGSDPAMYADHFTLNVEEGDRLILCSDGLSSMIPDGEIESIAIQSTTAQICTDNLVDAALAAGGGDNVTVVVVDLVDDGRLHEAMRKHRRNIALTALGALIALVLCTILLFFSIRNSCYLGIKDDAVAVYSGIPGSFMGIDLHWLEDETSVMLVDLPEDTRHRLEEGIPQRNLDEAAETVSKYRKQISEEQHQQEEVANTVRQGAEPAATEGGEAPTDGGDAQ
ncbi:MAG: Stp1/IreP family PP2C-type Ser/Thr phosphatase [Collinsella sp.]|nr:Stp1/IreP family PP2C-type Ser/Thr phosphatase [Collinsella sp.]